MEGVTNDPAAASSVTWLLAAVLGAAVVLWFLERRAYKVLSHIPGPYPYPVLGNLDRLIASYLKGGAVSPHVYVLESFCSWAHLFEKKRICVFWMTCMRPMIMCFKPESMEDVLSSSSLIDKSIHYKLLHSWLGTGLLTATGEKWKSRRKALTPTFHFRILQDFLPLCNKQSDTLVKKLKPHCGEGWVDIVPYVTLCTLDIICETAMGIQLDAQNNQESDYIKALHKVTSGFIYRNIRPWLWAEFVFSLFPSGRQFRKNVTIMHNYTDRVIRTRKEEMLQKMKNDSSVTGEATSSEDPNVDIDRKKRQPFLDLLLEQHFTNALLTEYNIREEVETFMFAGHDTTAMGISWTLMNLGQYPKVQAKVHEELDAIFQDDVHRQVTPDDLSSMKYLEQVIKETLRLYPSIPYVGRELKDDVSINGYTVPKGSTFLLFIYMLHRNPEVFPNPEHFDPDRFLPDLCSKRHPYSYLPFSAGPRNCIGQKFAMMVLKTVLSNFLRRYSISAVDKRDQILPMAEIILRPQQGIKLKIQERGHLQG